MNAVPNPARFLHTTVRTTASYFYNSIVVKLLCLELVLLLLVFVLVGCCMLLFRVWLVGIWFSLPISIIRVARDVVDDVDKNRRSGRSECNDLGQLLFGAFRVVLLVLLLV